MQVVPDTWSASPLAKRREADFLVVGKAIQKAGTWDAVSFGFIIVFAGACYGWNSALTTSFGLFLTCYFATAFAFTCTFLCVAEVSSFFPFGGGSFGYVRCIVNPSVGFLVGAAELVEYILFVVAQVTQLGKYCTTILGTSPSMEPVWWITFFVVTLTTQVCGGLVLWTSMRGLCALTVLVCLFHFFSVIGNADVAEYTTMETAAIVERSGMSQFMEIWPAVGWMFFGMEALVLMADDMDQPKRTVARANILCWLLIFTLTTMCMLASTMSYPGIVALSTEPTVMGAGLSHALGWGKRLATVATIPASFAAPYGFVFAAGKLTASMASSNVLPPVLGRAFGRNQTPVVGLCACSVLALSLMFIVRNVDHHYETVALDACMLNACFVYVCLAASYYICSDRYSNLERYFRNPTGIAGAGVTALAFSMLFIALALFQKDYRPIQVFVALLAIGSVYYWTAVRRREFFSNAEVNVFMKAYVMNANARRKLEVKKNNKQRIAAMHFWQHRYNWTKKKSVAPKSIAGDAPRGHDYHPALASLRSAQFVQGGHGPGHLRSKRANSSQFSQGSVYLGP